MRSDRKIDYMAEGERTVVLPAQDGLPATHHVFEAESVLAINAALASGRPLLLRGEPGIGKSQLARAAAIELRRAFVSKVVDSRTEPQDLLWTLDAIERLGQAQLMGALKEKDADTLRSMLDERRFVAPGPLWWAFAWKSAQEQADFKRSALKIMKTEGETSQEVASGTSEGGETGDASVIGPLGSPLPEGCSPDNGVVVLLDEIDKADGSVPNGLLEALGHGRFEGPSGAGMIAQTGVPPLIMITTNEERVLPDAFLRRCLVLHLKLPKDVKGFLVKRGRTHFDESECDEEVLGEAANRLIADRSHWRGQGLNPPGQAEYLDLLRAVIEQRKTKDEQLDLLKRLSQFTFRKHLVDEDDV